MGRREPDQEKGFFEDREKLTLVIIVAGVVLIGLVMGSSCNLHIEIKQTPTKIETKE